jgi:hypothetical protein
MRQLSFPRSQHPLPDIKALTKVKDLRVISHDGTPMPFREIITSTTEVDTVIVVLIRHFYCTCDQNFVRSLSRGLTPSFLSNIPPPFGPARVVIIGSGDPSRILPYSKDTSCEFPIFSDEGNHIHETLELFNTPTAPPRTMASGISLALRTVLKVLIGSGRNAHSTPQTELSCQNCGELIFKSGECVWTHRSGHVTPAFLIRVLRNIQ